MKKIFLTLALLLPLTSMADIQCKGGIGFSGQSLFTIKNSNTIPHVEWSMTGVIPAGGFRMLSEVLQDMLPNTPDLFVTKIDFKLNQSNCLSTVAEPLLHTCNISAKTAPENTEDVTITLKNGKTLTLKAVPSVVVTLEQNSSVNLDQTGQVNTYRKFHASVYLDFINPGLKNSSIRIYDIGNDSGMGACS